MTVFDLPSLLFNDDSKSPWKPISVVVTLRKQKGPNFARNLYVRKEKKNIPRLANLFITISSMFKHATSEFGIRFYTVIESQIKFHSARNTSDYGT